jgi:hypothetical protein
MSPSSPPGARSFARWSALGALAYGMAGQIIYHLLAAAHATAAPWPVVVVSCMPVAVLGLAAALTHLLRMPATQEGETAPGNGFRRLFSPTPRLRRPRHSPGRSRGKRHYAERACEQVPSDLHGDNESRRRRRDLEQWTRTGRR